MGAALVGLLVGLLVGPVLGVPVRDVLGVDDVGADGLGVAASVDGCCAAGSVPVSVGPVSMPCVTGAAESSTTVATSAVFV